MLYGPTYASIKVLKFEVPMILKDLLQDLQAISTLIFLFLSVQR